MGRRVPRAHTLLHSWHARPMAEASLRAAVGARRGLLHRRRLEENALRSGLWCAAELHHSCSGRHMTCPLAQCSCRAPRGAGRSAPGDDGAKRTHMLKRMSALDDDMSSLDTEVHQSPRTVPLRHCSAPARTLAMILS